MSTFGFAVQEASICLRCQLRLSLRRREPPIHQQRLQQVRRFGLDRRLHQEQEQAPVKDAGSYNETPDGVLDVQPPQNFTITYEPHKAPPKALNFRRLKDLPPPKDSLGFESLGQPAEVLILKDRQKGEDHGRPFQVSWPSQTEGHVPTEGMSSVEMLEEMNAERGIIGIDQVCRNIEVLKSEWIKDLELPSLDAVGRIVSKEQFDEVTRRLHYGFTISQLAAYLQRNEDMQSSDPFDLHNQFSSSLYARSPWNAGSTESGENRAPYLSKLGQDGMNAGAVMPEKYGRQAPRKSILINRLLRQCWHVRPREDESSSGEMDIRLQSVHLELIVNHKRGILKQISDTYGAKVEASRRDQLIRVTSDHDTCLDILKLIFQNLGNINSSIIKLPIESEGTPRSQNQYPDKDARQAIFSQIMQFTNTIITEKAEVSSKGELNIYYLAPDDEDMEDARRILNQVFRIRPATERKLLVGTAIRQNRDILVPIDVGTGLSLTERSQQWSRWCSRSTRRVDLNSQRDGAAVPLNTLRNPLDRKSVAGALTEFFAAPADKYELPQETSPHWESNISYWDSVSLGQVLFPTIGPKRATKTDDGLQPRLAEWQREFVTLVPGLVHSLENLGLDTIDPTSWNEEFLIIRLLPSFKDTLSVPHEVLPELEIRIFFDSNTETTSIHDVRLIRKNELDLLLPENTMDLRFTRRTCVYSRENALSPQITQFVQNSNLNIWGTGRFKTPTSLTISIPPYSLGPITDGRSSEGFQREEVEYTFASLEHRCEIGVPFRQPGSWASLTYTSIEAGKIGGRRDELSLRQPRRTKNIPSPSSSIEPEESSLNDTQHSASLLHAANALINAIENPVDNGIKQPGYGVGSQQRKMNRAKAREGRVVDRRGRVRPVRDLTRKVPVVEVRRVGRRGGL